MTNAGLACNDHIKVLDSSIMPLFNEGQAQEFTDYLNRERAGKYIRTHKDIALGSSDIFHERIATQAGLRFIGTGDNVGAHDHGFWTWEDGRCVLYYHSELKLYTNRDELVQYPVFTYLTGSPFARSAFAGEVKIYDNHRLAAKLATAELIYPMLREKIPQAAVVYTYALDTDTHLIISYSPADE